MMSSNNERPKIPTGHLLSRNDASGTGTGFHSILFLAESHENSQTMQCVAERAG